MKQYFTRNTIGAFVLGAVMAFGIPAVYGVYKRVGTLRYLASQGCQSLGNPTDEEAAKHLGQGFMCQGYIVAIPK